MGRYAHWLIRLPFATTFIGHGAGKVIMPVASADLLGLSPALLFVVGLAELLAGLGALLGGLTHRLAPLATRLAGVAAVPVLVGAIALFHWPRWSFLPSETHPMGGMEFQLLLLGVAAYFLMGGATRQPLQDAAAGPVRAQSRSAA